MSGLGDELKGRAKEMWGNLTDDEKLTVEGKAQQFLGEVKQNLNGAGDDLEKFKNEASDNIKNFIDAIKEGAKDNE